jgi:TRAP transporter TAXI family solute receptor
MEETMFDLSRRRLVSGVLALGLALAPAAASADDFVNILTGGTSGVYYPLGVAISKVLTDKVPGTRPSVQATKGSVENLNLIQGGKGEVGFTLGDSLAAAVLGSPDAGFKGPLDNVQTIGAIYPNYVQIVASEESGIKSLADLKGKRVSVGAPKSGTELNARAILAAAGMSYADLKRVDYSAYTEAVVLMKDNQLDAALISAGLGVAAVRDLASAVPIDIVPIAPDLIAKTQGAFTPITIPAHTYQGQEADVETAALNNFLVTHSEVPEALVYEMIKQFYLHLPEIQASSLAARSISRDKALISRPIALHPGAARYFREVGLLK